MSIYTWSATERRERAGLSALYADSRRDCGELQRDLNSSAAEVEAGRRRAADADNRHAQQLQRARDECSVRIHRCIDI